MSYLRWLCAMHFAKLTRYSSALVETVNAFRLHRQQKTLACEAAAKARAEFWSRLAEKLRRIRTERPTFRRKSIQSRCLNHEHPTKMHAHETGTEVVKDSGSFRSAAKQVNECRFNGEPGNQTPQPTTALSTVLRSSLRKTRETISKLSEQQKQSLRGVLQQLQEQRQSSAKSASKKSIATSRKPLTLHAMSKSCTRSEGEPPGELQQLAPQADEKTATKANKSHDEPNVLVRSTAHNQSKHKTLLPLPTMQKCYSPCQSSEMQKAMLLPERPNILVLPEMNDPLLTLQKHASSAYYRLQQLSEKTSKQPLKSLPAPANTLKSSADRQISTAPHACRLPTQVATSMKILVTEVLDKPKTISLPAGRSVSERPKRSVHIEEKKRGPVQAEYQQ
ncbi:uncharacterized protein LOC128856471 [Anastrepha ludens]|uniref:uncharacterized protein LOC128856471 n=1 Tax=Anastrepha ludens TaxID=28586 RepID=UPI0023B07B20|nr:uncharacterized protein LOC128856471 [Anastrepha ludens]